jgi:pimeloyl-ACP methyl ester carboxylesterase
MPLLQLNYKQIHYTDLKPDGDVRETLIFMHGLGSSQDYYHAVTQGLVPKGFRCIIFDNTGAGRSPYTFIEQSIWTLADDIIGILDALAVAKVIVIGHSMGGYVMKYTKPLVNRVSTKHAQYCRRAYGRRAE